MGEADGAAPHRVFDDLEIIEPQNRMFACRGVTDRTRAAVGKYDGNGAVARVAEKANANRLNNAGYELRPQRYAAAVLINYCFSH
jgi:hypothetical protein